MAFDIETNELTTARDSIVRVKAKFPNQSRMGRLLQQSLAHLSSAQEYLTKGRVTADGDILDLPKQ